MNKINIIFFACLILLFTSCEDLKFGDSFLEMPAGGDDNLETVFSCKENAEQALVTAYLNMPDGLMNHRKLMDSDLLESLTDIGNSTMGWGACKRIYYPGQVNSAEAQSALRYNFMNNGWPSIRAAWTFINNVDRVPDMSDEDKLKRKAEAKTIIAIHYIDMFRNFGAIPIINKSYNPSEEFNVPRATAEETLNFIIKLLDEAIPHLPWNVDALNDGRMTKAAAMGLKVRILLFAASPLLNNEAPYMEGEASDKHMTWFGGKDENRWNEVIDACEEFFNALNTEGFYALVSTGNPRKDFTDAYFNRYNGEVLISTRAKTYYPKNLWGARFPKSCQFGSGGVTLNYVDMFPMLDGSNFDWENPEHVNYPFFDKNGKMTRDPRLYESVLICGDNYKGRKAETWIGGRERKKPDHDKQLCATGFCLRKFRRDIQSMVNKFYSWPYLRLPEIYLSMAEALNEVGRTEEAYKYVEPIRTRVGMPNIKSGMSKEEFREAILRERALEFGFEEVRLYDLIRWKRADRFSMKLQGLDAISSNKGKTVTFKKFVLPQKRAWQGEGWDPKWYLSPFPINEVNKRYGLIQNPGW